MIKKFFAIHHAMRTIALVFLSSILLVLSFPKVDCSVLAWVALVPLLFAAENRRGPAAFFIGYLAGILFFIGTLYWFIHVTGAGMIVLIAYLSVYIGIFTVAYGRYSRRGWCAQLILVPSMWVILEFVRSYLFTGFGWASIGHTQYRLIPLIQIADMTGMYGVSFLVVMSNVAVKQTIDGLLLGHAGANKKKSLRPLGVLLCSIVICVSYGFFRIHDVDSSASSVDIAIVQGNIAQELKWVDSQKPYIFEKYQALTRAVAQKNPDVIIWPETAFPWYPWEAPESFERLKEFVDEIDIPLLLGVVTKIKNSYYNSAVLISRDGEIIEQHDKMHLVMFGEYIPLREHFPFLSGIVPIGDFTAGTSHTLFPVFPGNDVAKYFSVLVCFEDTVSSISRAFTQRGAHLLVNITNDAWFQDTSAPFLHMMAALFRSVENRRSLVRVTNTGVSCVIDPRGIITKCVHNSHGKKTYVTGSVIERVTLSDRTTFYTKYGDIFTYICFGSILMGMMRRK